MRSDFIILPDDVGNAGKRHKTLRDGSSPANHIPMVADHLSPGVLSGEFTFKQLIAATAGAARFLVLLNPAGSGVELFVICARWKFSVTTAQALQTFNALTYVQVTQLMADTAANLVMPGRGETKTRKAIVSMQGAAPSPAVLQATLPFFREALAVGSAGARDIGFIEPRAPGVYVQQGGAFVLGVNAGSVAGAWEGIATLGWEEYLT